MATPFRNKCLEVLDRVYDFVGGLRTVSQADLNLPIQLVHDVSREAELGSPYGRNQGYGSYNWGNNHAGAGTLNSVYEPYVSILNSLALDPVYVPPAGDVDLWLIGYGAYITANTLGSLVCNLMFSAFPPETGFVNIPFLWAQDVVTTTDWPGTGTSLGIAELNDGSKNMVRNLRLPMLLPYGCRLGIRSNTTGAANVFLSTVIWIGRKGTTPPGAR
jgi:hypothetical protein